MFSRKDMFKTVPPTLNMSPYLNYLTKAKKFDFAWRLFHNYDNRLLRFYAEKENAFACAESGIFADIKIFAADKFPAVPKRPRAVAFPPADNNRDSVYGRFFGSVETQFEQIGLCFGFQNRAVRPFIKVVNGFFE